MNRAQHIPHYLIESFLATVDNPSLQKAADQLGITQSAISRQMQLLEELLPYKVFTFDGRKKVLTKYGQVLYKLLAAQFSQTQEMIMQASLHFSDPQKAHVKICGRGEFLDVIARNLKFTGTVSFLNMNNSSAVDAVLKRQCDIGVVHSASDSSELILKRFFTSRLRIVIPKSFLHAKPSKRELAAHLRKLPCLLYKQEDSTVDHFLREFGVDIDDLYISRIYSNYSTLLDLINDGKGWSIIPSNLEISEKDYYVFQLEGRTPDERIFYLCFRKEIKESSWFDDFVSEMKRIVQ